MSGSTSCVVFAGSSSSRWVLGPFGLTQGSVFGPLLYFLHTLGISTLLTSHALLIQSYADDVLVYISTALRSVQLRLTESIGRLWMRSCPGDRQTACGLISPKRNLFGLVRGNSWLKLILMLSRLSFFSLPSPMLLNLASFEELTLSTYVTFIS